MKKMPVICFALLFLLCHDAVFAQEADTFWEEAVGQIEQNATLPQSFSFSETTRRVAQGEWKWDPASILKKLSDLFFSELVGSRSALIKMVIIAILAGVLCNLQEPFGQEGVADTAFLICFCMIAGLALSVFSEIMQTAQTTIDYLTLFMQALIPPVSAMIVASGCAASASLSPSLFLCMQVITYLAKNIFLPMVLVITVLSVVNNMTERFSMGKLIEFVRVTLKWSSGILLTVFVGILSLQGFGNAFTDSVAGKTLKYAICNFIPLVGNVLSDSVEAVCSGTIVIKNAVGVSGVLALFSICAAPLLKLLAISVLYRLAAGVAEPATDRRIVNLLSDLADRITQVFVILLMVCVMFVIGVAMLCMVSNLPLLVR